MKLASVAEYRHIFPVLEFHFSRSSLFGFSSVVVVCGTASFSTSVCLGVTRMVSSGLSWESMPLSGLATGFSPEVDAGAAISQK
jgi:hypothetical protein